MVNETEVKKFKEKFSLSLLSKFMVLGVGIGSKVIKGHDTGELCIKVYVRQKLPDKFLLRYGKDQVILPEIEGVQTDVVEITSISQSDTVHLPPRRRRKLRPAPSGCSISHYAVNGRGTLGAWVEDKDTGQPLLLSCWHVIANKGMCMQGDPILQPGRIDGGKVPNDVVAYLERWKDVKILGSDLDKCKERIRMALANGIKIPINFVDAALARPISNDVVTNEVLGISVDRINSAKNVKRGDKVKKSGATTGVTRGIIRDLNVDFFISYPPVGIALFKNQILISVRGGYSDFGLANPANYLESLMNIKFTKSIGVFFSG